MATLRQWAEGRASRIDRRLLKSDFQIRRRRHRQTSRGGAILPCRQSGRPETADPLRPDDDRVGPRRCSTRVLQKLMWTKVNVDTYLMISAPAPFNVALSAASSVVVSARQRAMTRDAAPRAAVIAFT